jgi:nucleoside phosphorylase
MPPLSAEKYHVGWICALEIEMAAARAMLDEDYGPVRQKDPRDHNTYSAGRIHDHDVIIACLPAGVPGLAAAATVAKDMLRTFQNLRFGLLVGIGGGIPDRETGIGIRLGDVVVSQPSATSGGVIQFDKGKAEEEGQFVRIGALNAPPPVLLTALNYLKAEHEINHSRMSIYLSDMIQRYPKMGGTGYTFPGIQKDRLYRATWPRSMGKRTWDESDTAQEVIRPARHDMIPHVHYGIIVSGNQVIKDAVVRDRLRDNFHALCVEMEAAGLMNSFPCLVIRGICDYADSHKDDLWQRYAAATAAAYAKELLLHVSTEQARGERPILQVLGQ